MPFKVTMFLSQKNYTSSETHYDVSAGNLTSAQDNAIALCSNRAQLLGSFASIAAVRILDTSLPRIATYLKPGTFATVSLLPQTPAGGPTGDRAYSALMLTLLGKWGGGPTSAVKKLYLTGIPDQVIGDALNNGNSGVLTLGAFGNALYGYLTFLSTVYAFRVKVYAPAQIVQRVLTNSGFPGEIGVQVANQITFTQALSLNFKGFRKVNSAMPGLQGAYYVDPLSPPLLPGASAPWIYYLQNTPLVQTANIKTNGIVAPQLWSYAQYSPAVGSIGTPPLNPLAMQATHRKRGARELAPSGRSRRLVR